MGEVITDRDLGDETDEYDAQFQGLTEGVSYGYGGILIELACLHKKKSNGYGTGEDPYANFTAVASTKG